MGVAIVYGSSSTNGLGDYMYGGYPSRVKVEFNRRHELYGMPQHAVRDRSTTAERIKTTKQQLEADIKEFKTDLADVRIKRTKVAAIFSLGVYDSSHRIDAGKNHTPIEDFTTLVREIGQLSLEAGWHTTFIGMTPVLNKGVLLHGLDFFHEKERALYERRTRIVADEIQIPYIDIWGKCVDQNGGNTGFLSKDLVHPGIKGHELTHRLVQPVIDEHLGVVFSESYVQAHGNSNITIPESSTCVELPARA